MHFIHIPCHVISCSSTCMSTIKLLCSPSLYYTRLWQEMTFFCTYNYVRIFFYVYEYEIFSPKKIIHVIFGWWHFFKIFHFIITIANCASRYIITLLSFSIVVGTYTRRSRNNLNIFRKTVWHCCCSLKQYKLLYHRLVYSSVVVDNF